MAQHLAPGVNVGEIVKSVFQQYKADIGKKDKRSTQKLLKKIAGWTEVGFIDDVFSDLQKLGAGTATPTNRAWAILYCLRFMTEDPEKSTGKSKWSSSLDYAEHIERLILLPGKKGQRTYRLMNGGEGPPHPEDPHPNEPTTPDPDRLPARFFEAHLPEIHQSGREEFIEVRAALLERKARRVALVAAVTGPGGYGKTAIAEEIVNDLSVRRAFPGGIYWLQFGLRFGGGENEAQGYINTQEAISDLLVRQYADSETKHFDLSTLEKLFEALPDDRLLIVADDIWNSEQAKIQSSLPDRVAVLATTRSQAIAKKTTYSVKVERIAEAAAFAILTHDMGKLAERQDARLRQLCKKFQGWPLLLRLANGHFRALRDEGGSIEDAIDEYEEVLAGGNVAGWDNPEPGLDGQQFQRRTLAGLCIETGLSAVLSSEQRRLFDALAVFPDDTDIPFDVVDLLWETLSEDRKRNEQVRPSALRLRAHNYSLFRELDARKRTFRLHDEMLNYLRGNHTANELSQLHEQMVTALSRTCARDWSKLPKENAYGWAYLLQHMENSGNAEEANRLRVSFPWLEGLFNVHKIEGLFAAFRSNDLDEASIVVRRAVHRSAHVMRTMHDQLALQLYGRLGHVLGNAQIERLAAEAHSHCNSALKPRWPHLDGLKHEHIVLEGHTGPVFSAAFNRSGTRIVTASSDSTARLWDAETGAPIGDALDGHAGPVFRAAFNRDGTRIVTASSDKTARLWDAETGAPIGDALEGHADSVSSVAFNRSGTRIVTASEDNTARLWDAETGAPIGDALEGHTGPVFSAAFNRDGTRIVTASSDSTARLWDAETGAPIGDALEGHTRSAFSAAFNRDGTRIVTASSDKTARLWDAETGAPIGAALEGHADSVTSAAFNRSGTRIVTASYDNTARLWDAETGVPVGDALEGHAHSVFSAAFNRDGTRIVTASSDSTARLWDAETGAPIGDAIEGHTGPLFNAAFNRDGTRIVTTSSDKTARLWDAETGAPIGDALEGHADSVSCAAFNRDGTRIVTVSEDNTARLWDAETGAPIGDALEGHTGPVVDAAFNRDGTQIVTVSEDNTARLWDAETGAPIGDALEGHSGPVFSAAFNRDGTRIVTASSDSTARLWDAETGAPIGAALEGHMGPVTSAAFNRDGTKIVTASHDKTARLWDAETGAPIGDALKGHAGLVFNAAFNRSGTRIVTVSEGKTARLWDAETGAPIGDALEGHTGPVVNAAFNRDGTQIVTVSEDKTARLWDAETGAPIGDALEGHTGRVVSAAFNRDGTRIVTASDDHTARLWDGAKSTEIGLIVLDGAVTGVAISIDDEVLVTTDKTVCVLKLQASCL